MKRKQAVAALAMVAAAILAWATVTATMPAAIGCGGREPAALNPAGVNPAKTQGQPHETATQPAPPARPEVPAAQSKPDVLRNKPARIWYNTCCMLHMARFPATWATDREYIDLRWCDHPGRPLR